MLQHHDALRLRITSSADNWQQQIAAPDPAIPFKHIDLSALPPDEQPAARTPGNQPEFPGTYRRQNMFVPAATNSALRALAQQQQMTLNTLVQGAWALIHSAYTGQDDVVFGRRAAG